MRPLLMMLGCAVAPGFVVQALGAQPPTAGTLPTTRAVRVQIELAQIAYRTVDTVVVRLILTNTGAVPLEVIAVPPWRAVRLIVTGPDGRPIDPVDDPDERSYHSGRPYPLQPQTPDTAGYKGQQWTGLQHWGYGPLPAGRYTLTAVPIVVGYDMQVDTTTVRSNQVAITITP